MPWLSWPIRFARTRWSATRPASGEALPPEVKMEVTKRRRLSAVARTRSLLGPQYITREEDRTMPEGTPVKVKKLRGMIFLRNGSDHHTVALVPGDEA